MIVAEVLTGIALVKQATDFIKSNIDTVKDIGEIGDTIEDLFKGEEECQKARAKKAQEQMQQMRVMIDNRFGVGTWQSIVDLRAKRIREAKEEALQIKKEKVRKQKELYDIVIQGTTVLVVVGLMAAAVVYLIFGQSL